VQYNADLQVAYYEAAMEVFSENENFAGLLGWAWYPWSDAGGVGDIDFTPQNKRLETEARRLFQPSPWQNGFAPEDVNDDGKVTTLDVLELIRRINAHPNDTSLPDPPDFPPPYYDVNGDGQSTSLDVLQVIVYINKCGIGSGGGEGEGPRPASQAGLFPAMDIGQQLDQVSPNVLNDSWISTWYTGQTDVPGPFDVHDTANDPSPWAARFVGRRLTHYEHEGDDWGIQPSSNRQLPDDFDPRLIYLDSILTDIGSD
jgi:hypothetical protein